MSDTMSPGATADGAGLISRPGLLAGVGLGLAALGVAAALALKPPPMLSSPHSPEATRASLAPNESVVEPGAVVDKAPPASTTASPRAPVAAMARAEPQERVASSTPTRTAPACTNCGVVEAVHAVKQKGQGTGLGAVAGGVVGGALGNQVGKGNGRAAMTVLGAVGGGMAGHEIEKRARSEIVYEVRVRMDDGRVRTLRQRSAPTVGSRVVVNGTTLKSVKGSNAGA